MKKTVKLVYIALMTAAALILSYVESLIPFDFGIAGIKLGLANAATVTVLYLFDAKTAACVSASRILLSSLLFGTWVSLIYSAVGGAVSFFGMLLFKNTNKFGIIGVSAVGGVMHNVGQVLTAVCILETIRLTYYIPILVISGVLTGVIIGFISGLLIKRLPNVAMRNYKLKI